MASISDNVKSSFNAQILTICSIFLAANLIASTLNHIDDTDETYGYYEPLHYLLFGVGMQTWEYSPVYAIRTYTFLTPFWILGSALKVFQLPKLSIFYGIRALLGALAALSETYFVHAIYENFGRSIGEFTFLLTLFSSGILYCSTALLPSAVIMSFVMVASASWLNRHYSLTILIGCISVCWSGWPFIGIIYVPFGLHMLIDTYYFKRGIMKKLFTKTSSCHEKSESNIERLKRVFYLIIQGASILIAVSGSAGAIDLHMYKKRTFPTWNILAYNAIGGSGDELYGTEPMAYYIRNLTLNMGIAWPLAVAAPVLLFREYLYTSGSVTENSIRKGILFLPAMTWLCVLFMRPHKEERFLYPIYPLLAFMAAFAVSTMIDVVCDISSAIFCGFSHAAAKSHDTSLSRKGRGNTMKKLLTAGCIAVTFILCSSRSISNYVNFKGYLSLWTQLGNEISATNIQRLKDYYSDPGADVRSSSDGYPPVTVCIGGEWYTFPSHFFLPQNAKLEYIRGTFHGQLPQHFRSYQGTSAAPLQDFNDRNLEEQSRYVSLSTCDYLVATMDPRKSAGPVANQINSKSWMDRLQELRDVRLDTDEDDGRADADEVMQFKSEGIEGQPAEEVYFRLLFYKKIIDPFHSSSALARAYFLPGVSKMKNVYNSYSAFKFESSKS